MINLKAIYFGTFMALMLVVMVVDHYQRTDEDVDDYIGRLDYDDDNAHLKSFQLVRLQTLESQLGTDEKYRYFVNDHGNLKIELVSKEGDCDLYAMEGDTHKDANTFTHNTLKSVSFDKDFIYIGDFVKRPVTVIVHSHPDQLKCAFKITKYLISTRDPSDRSQYNGGVAQQRKYSSSDVVNLNSKNSDYLFFYLPNLLENFYFKQNEQNQSSGPDYFGEFDKREDKHSSQSGQSKDSENEQDDNEEEESILWTVFIHLVTFLAEALL